MLTNLNENQKRAVTSSSPYVRIIAGAGSGKTRVLTTRIAFLVDEIGADPKKIAAITFTNKAAREMKQRVETMLGVKGFGVHISTIHALCVRILREDIMCMNMPKNFTVLDADDQKSVLKEAYKELEIDVKNLSYSSALDYISNNKSAEISYEQAMKMANGLRKEMDKAEVYKYYVERLQSMYALDFDDLLLWTVRMFKLHDTVLAKWQYRFQYILVDEFQDIDNVQYELIQQLAGAHNQVYVVGDPDQTIYTWRGANVEIIMHFERDFSPCETIVLDENYRSTPMILNGANSLIKNNRERVKKDLFSRKDPGEKITHYTAVSEDAEALWIAQQIVDLHKRGVNYSKIAVLYRANYISRSIEKGLLDFHVPYVIYGGIRFYDRAEVKDILSYLRVLVGGDDLALKRIINVPKRGLGNKTTDTLLEIARKERVFMYDVMKRPGLFKGKTENELRKLCDLIEDWKKRMVAMPLDKILEMVFEESGYRKMLEDGKEEERISNIKELMNDLHDFMLNYPDSDLSEYLQMINLYTDKNDMDANADFVQLMTVHASKGLEFDYVFVCGLSDGVFPSERTLMEGTKGLEEERRLAYVAYTRAKNKLYLTEPQGYSFVLSRARTASRFINEIDEQYIEHAGFNFSNKDFQRSTFSIKEPVAQPVQKRKPGAFKTGDKVVHTVFGDGQVVQVKGNMMDVVFSFPHGVKTIMVNHPSITKK
ncbi:MAG: UvrD-helicase domain-containing protein [Erysipelotrichaceae bacterium]|nr:UvrD-helicase domain-containing protein [Erysipelotrichaceae bacterium]